MLRHSLLQWYLYILTGDWQLALYSVDHCHLFLGPHVHGRSDRYSDSFEKNLNEISAVSCSFGNNSWIPWDSLTMFGPCAKTHRKGRAFDIQASVNGICYVKRVRRMGVKLAMAGTSHWAFLHWLCLRSPRTPLGSMIHQEDSGLSIESHSFELW